MHKIPLKYFVSYAHKNEKLALEFLETFQENAYLSKHYTFTQWIDRKLTIGEDWNEQIQTAITECDFGLLLLSPSFFNRPYIRDKELPHFITQESNRENEKSKITIHKAIIPIGLASFPFGDLLGLEQTQIYRYQSKPGKAPKFYNETRGHHKDRFVQDLLQKVYIKLDKYQVKMNL